MSIKLMFSIVTFILRRIWEPFDFHHLMTKFYWSWVINCIISLTILYSTRWYLMEHSQNSIITMNFATIGYSCIAFRWLGGYLKVIVIVKIQVENEIENWRELFIAHVNTRSTEAYKNTLNTYDWKLFVWKICWLCTKMCQKFDEIIILDH